MGNCNFERTRDTGAERLQLQARPLAGAAACRNVAQTHTAAEDKQHDSIALSTCGSLLVVRHSRDQCKQVFLAFDWGRSLERAEDLDAQEVANQVEDASDQVAQVAKFRDPYGTLERLRRMDYPRTLG